MGGVIPGAYVAIMVFHIIASNYSKPSVSQLRVPSIANQDNRPTLIKHKSKAILASWWRLDSRWALS
jgi:hypothetical protein